MTYEVNVFNLLKNIFRKKDKAKLEFPRMTITYKKGEPVTILDGNYKYVLFDGKVHQWSSIEGIPIGSEPDLIDMHNNCKRIEEEYRKIIKKEYIKVIKTWATF